VREIGYGREIGETGLNGVPRTKGWISGRLSSAVMSIRNWMLERSGKWKCIEEEEAIHGVECVVMRLDREEICS